MAVTSLFPASDETFTTAVTPGTRALLHTDGFFRVRETATDRVILVDADEVATQVVLAAERATTAGVVAYMRLQPVGVVCTHMSLEIVSACESTRTEVTFVSLLGIIGISATIVVINDGTGGGYSM